MSIQGPADLKGLRDAGRVVRLTLDALEAAVRPGVTTADLDDVAARILAAHGARSAPALVYGFPGAALISVNEQVVHGVPGRRRLRPGDIVKLDVTVEKDGYMSDAARTVVLAPASELALRLQRCARRAFEQAVSVARAGNRVSEIGRTVEHEVRRQGFTVIQSLSGHGIGRTIHEPPSVPNYFDRGQMDVLTEGLVLTIEPLIASGSGEIYEDSDRWTIRTRDGGLAAHHEHTLLITKGRPELLTAA